MAVQQTLRARRYVWGLPVSAGREHNKAAEISLEVSYADDRSVETHPHCQAFDLGGGYENSRTRPFQVSILRPGWPVHLRELPGDVRGLRPSAGAQREEGQKQPCCR